MEFMTILLYTLTLYIILSLSIIITAQYNKTSWFYFWKYIHIIKFKENVGGGVASSSSFCARTDFGATATSLLPAEKSRLPAEQWREMRNATMNDSLRVCVLRGNMNNTACNRRTEFSKKKNYTKYNIFTRPGVCVCYCVTCVVYRTGAEGDVVFYYIIFTCT